MSLRPVAAAVGLAVVLVVVGCSAEGPRPTTAAPTADVGPRTTLAPLAAYPPQRIGPALRHRMRFSHASDCPVPLRDLRYLRVPYVGFDGRRHLGEIVVHRRYAADVAGVFATLLEARWPIRRMRLVDDYRGDDDRSMRANNTSGYNCRRVSGSRSWSTHAYGTAVDLNPVQNPYLVGPDVRPAAGRRFATLGRSVGAPVPDGVVRAGDVVVRAFGRIGWEWGGTWASPDYQHFSAPR